MHLTGRTAALAGEFTTLSHAEAVRRLEASGARVTGSPSADPDLLFAGEDAVPETNVAHELDVPVFDEEALRWMTEPDRSPREGDPGAGAAFLEPAELGAAITPDAVAALLESADWSAFAPARDLPPLRARLAELERDHGVTEAHRLATRRLREAAEVRLLHPYGHQESIHAFALSPCGRYLATGCWLDDLGDEQTGSLQIWEVEAGRCVNVLRGIPGGLGWPGFARSIQWSADAARLGLSYNTNQIGVWEADQEGGEPVADFGTADGNGRPSDFALSPDGQRAYLQRYNGQVGVEGVLVPLGRGSLLWSPRALPGEHPYTLHTPLPAPLRAAIEESAGEEGRGVWLERPTWSADGSRLRGVHLSVDVATGLPDWFDPTIREPAAYSPSGRLLAHATERGLRFRDARTGRPVGEEVATGPLSSLHWTPAGDGERLAAVVLGSAAGPPRVEVFDGTTHRLRLEVPHPGREVDRYRDDDSTWSWAPDGERAVCLTDRGEAEVWSVAGEGAQRSLTFEVPEDTDAVLWGAGDTVAVVAGVEVRFVRADSGEVVGAFVFPQEPDGPDGAGVDEAVLGDRVFALDEDDWALALESGAVVAPPGRERDLDAVLTWSVGRRHAWPVRWGEVEVLADVAEAAGRLDAGD